MRLHDSVPSARAVSDAMDLHRSSAVCVLIVSRVTGSTEASQPAKDPVSTISLPFPSFLSCVSIEASCALSSISCTLFRLSRYAQPRSSLVMNSPRKFQNICIDNILSTQSQVDMFHSCAYMQHSCMHMQTYSIYIYIYIYNADAYVHTYIHTQIHIFIQLACKNTCIHTYTNIHTCI